MTDSTTSSTSSWSDIFFTLIAPTLGCLLASSVFAAPIHDLRIALNCTDLGVLNPSPWAFMTGNTLGWVAYAYYTNDPFVLASNLPGLILSLWLNMGATKLQYLAKLRTIPNALVTRRNSTTAAVAQRQQSQPPSPLVHKDDNSLVYTPQDVLLLRILVVWAIVLVMVGWIDGLFDDTASTAYAATVVGITVNINLLAFYAAPLSTIATVLSTKSSDTIHRPTVVLNCANATFWVLYGIARLDPIIYVPNGIGLLLGISQATLCVVYPNTTTPTIANERIRNPHSGGEMEFQPVAVRNTDDIDDDIVGVDPDVTATSEFGRYKDRESNGGDGDGDGDGYDGLPPTL